MTTTFYIQVDDGNIINIENIKSIGMDGRSLEFRNEEGHLLTYEYIGFNDLHQGIVNYRSVLLMDIITFLNLLKEIN